MSLSGRTLIGAVLVLIGLLVFAGNLGIITSETVRTIVSYWPVLLILWGLLIIYRKEDRGDVISGAVVLIVGLLFLGNHFEFFRFGWAEFWKIFWPVVLILVGWSLLSNRAKTQGGNIAFLGGLEKDAGQWILKSEAYGAILGGVELDLSHAVFSEPEITLDLSAFLGGIDLRVPDDVTVYCKGTAALGGIVFFGKGKGGIIAMCDESRLGSSNKVLKIHCRTVMGGIEITRSKA